jgi:hypothetical protein
MALYTATFKKTKFKNEQILPRKTLTKIEIVKRPMKNEPRQKTTSNDKRNKDNLMRSDFVLAKISLTTHIHHQNQFHKP